MSRPRKLDTIREQQIEEMAHGLGLGPTALVRLIPDANGIGLGVWLYWKKDRPLQLLALSGRPRTFRHFGRMLKWAASHDIVKVELETIDMTDELRRAIGTASSETDQDVENEASTEPSIDLLDQDKHTVT